MSEHLEKMLADHAAQDREAQQEISDRLQTIEGTLKQYQGFRNGAAFVLVVFWTIVVAFGKEMLTWLRG